MPAGGKRPGSGRKPGQTTQRTREIADRITQAALEGKELTPLEVIIESMHHFRRAAMDAEAALMAITREQIADEAGEDPEQQFKAMMARVMKSAELRKEAVACATHAAPYIHPRLASIEHKVSKSAHEDALRQMAAELNIIEGESEDLTHRH